MVKGVGWGSKGVCIKYAAGGQWVRHGAGPWEHEDGARYRKTDARPLFALESRSTRDEVPADTSGMLVLSEIGGSESHVLHVAGRVRIIHVTLVTVWQCGSAAARFQPLVSKGALCLWDGREVAVVT